MKLELELSPELGDQLIAEAKRAGKAPNEYAEELIRRRLDAVRSLDEVFAPIHASSQLNGASEEELTAFSNEVIREARAARKVR